MMNPFIYKTTCSVCGGPGVAHARDMGRDWLGTKFAHTDPNQCREYLAEQRRKIEEEKAPANQ